MTRIIEVETVATQKRKQRQEFLQFYQEAYEDFRLAAGALLMGTWEGV